MARKPLVSHCLTASITSLRPIDWIFASTINSWLGALNSVTGVLGALEQPNVMIDAMQSNVYVIIFISVSSYKKGKDQASDKAA